uniref:Uncharacterized protein n=1 Tax=Rhizophora mucronata TaxID=61149 RepID=A0A2P2Q3N4_RHIMU
MWVILLCLIDQRKNFPDYHQLNSSQRTSHSILIGRKSLSMTGLVKSTAVLIMPYL